MFGKISLQCRYGKQLKVQCNNMSCSWNQYMPVNIDSVARGLIYVLYFTVPACVAPLPGNYEVALALKFS